jgi:hypothetical protein
MPQRAFLVVLFVVAVFASTGCTKGIGARDLDCGALREARGVQICQKIERELEWTWTGHAILAPGWRPSFATARRVFCDLPVNAADAPVLARMKQHADWRPQSAAQSQLNLLGAAAIAALNSAGAVYRPIVEEIEQSIGDEVSIFNRTNPDYVLKGGCARR